MYLSSDACCAVGLFFLGTTGTDRSDKRCKLAGWLGGVHFLVVEPLLDGGGGGRIDEDGLKGT